MLGGAEEGLRGRQTQKKALVAIAAEEDGAGIGRIRMKRIRGASKQQLCTASSKRLSSPTARSTPTAGKGTSAWRRLAIGTSTDFLAGSSQSASELLPHVHRVAALLKRWLIGTHQGAVSREHLDYYLDGVYVSIQSTTLSSPGKALLPACTNRPRPLGPRPIQRWSNTYAAGGPANHKMWGSSGVKCIPRIYGC